jgi:hypothetical protein
VPQDGIVPKKIRPRSAAKSPHSLAVELDAGRAGD